MSLTEEDAGAGRAASRVPTETSRMTGAGDSAKRDARRSKSSHGIVWSSPPVDSAGQRISVPVPSVITYWVFLS
jgi:hypothetical protein